MNQKQKMRRALLAQRSEVLDSVRKAWNVAIADLILASSVWKNARRVFAYWSMETEVSTHSLMANAFSQGKDLLLPRCTRGKPEMEAVLVENLESDLCDSGFRKIRQPREDLPRWPDMGSIDLVLVPGLGFDLEGNRLGFGAGYYDRFLAQIPYERRLALAFSLQIQERIPVCEWDQKVAVMATENGWVGPLAAQF